MTTPRPQASANRQIENDRVIVTEWRFEAGAETGWHRYGYDYVVVPGTNGKLLLESVAGDKLAELTAGKAYFRPAGIEHNVVNANEYEFYFIEIELR